MNDLGQIFGKSVWPLIKRENEIVIFNVDYDRRRCNILVGGDEYWVSRDGLREWHIGKDGYMFTCISQWELLAWIVGRL